MWRSYFDTNLFIAENKGMISHAAVQFLMGHSGDIERTYTLNKKHLPEQLIEDLRNSYQRALQFLETGSRQAQVDYVAVLRSNLPTGLRLMTTQEISHLNLTTMSEEEFGKLLQKKQEGKIMGNGSSQKVVALAELETRIERGFEMVPGSNFRNGDGLDKVVVRLPR
jgi:hypothetical protein